MHEQLEHLQHAATRYNEVQRALTLTTTHKRTVESDARATGAVAGRARAAATYYATQQHVLQCTVTYTNTHCNAQTQELQRMREQVEQLLREREKLLKAATANNKGKLSGGSRGKMNRPLLTEYTTLLPLSTAKANCQVCQKRTVLDSFGGT